MFSSEPSRFASFMRVRETRAHPHDDAERVLARKSRVTLLAHLPHDRANVFAVNVLHRDVVSAVDLADIEDLHDVPDATASLRCALRGAACR